jgi:hypothetical protein
VIGDRAFTAALLAGDVTQAAALAPRAPDANENARRLGVMPAPSSVSGRIARKRRGAKPRTAPLA